MSACREENCWEIDGRTGLFCLLGSPVEHSLSPAMHNEAFRLLGINARYLAFDLQKEDLPGALPVFRKMKLQGCNLTMPLKETVIPLCDSISKEARLAHSVNTLVFRENGAIEGHSTDGKGFFRGLEAKGLVLKGKKLSLLGLGGAGKAILSYGIGTELSEIEVLVREESKGKYEDFVERCEKESGRKISLKSLEKEPVALIILDLMLPGIDGYEVCRRIRTSSNVPIIMLTARSEERDELQGFSLGVDEYITKPFSPKILVARVEAILRRSFGVEEEKIEMGGIVIDKAAHEVSIDGKIVELSYKEFELLNHRFG